jgi:hypothetical protein
MNDIERIALAKAATSHATDADKPSTGLHIVDFTTHVRVCGTLKKLEDGETLPTLGLGLTLALLCRSADLPRERARVLLAHVIAQAYAAGEHGPDSDIQERMADFDAALELVKKTAPDLPRKPRAGNLTAQLSLSEVGLAQEAPKGRRRKAA